jgi:hypothetical protein
MSVVTRSTTYSGGPGRPGRAPRTVTEVESQPDDEEFHAKLLQVIDLHPAAQAFLS